MGQRLFFPREEYQRRYIRYLGPGKEREKEKKGSGFDGKGKIRKGKKGWLQKKSPPNIKQLTENYEMEKKEK